MEQEDHGDLQPPPVNDTVEDRGGEWMHTSTGKRFFPVDPRVEDICISDIANGLALDCRYGGQGRVDRFYSVAEHCYHMAVYARDKLGFSPREQLAVLLHDAGEAYLNDLPRAVKHAVGQGYEILEARIHHLVMVKYVLVAANLYRTAEIKDLDRRMVPIEKAAIMRYPQPWAYDQFEPLEDVAIECYDPPSAKTKFLETYYLICDADTSILREHSEI